MLLSDVGLRIFSNSMPNPCLELEELWVKYFPLEIIISQIKCGNQLTMDPTKMVVDSRTIEFIYVWF
jgi:hypothetical protein